MKKKIYYISVLLIFTILTFMSLFVIIKTHQQVTNLNAKEVVEKNNNYVIQNSIISSARLDEMVNEADVKVIFVQSDDLPAAFIPNTIVVPFKMIITLQDNIPYIASQSKIDAVLSQAGIDHDDVIILYDTNNSPYVTRMFWTLKVYGHEYVKILNGGLNEWTKTGLKTVSQPIKPEHTIYTAHEINQTMIATIQNIQEAIKNPNEVILDVRSREEYALGHIPTAINIPYQLALEPNGLFKTFEALQEVYHSKGVTPDKTTIYVYCSSGNRAAFTYFVLQELMGYNNVKVYDGSYLEYIHTKLPIEK